MLALRPYQGKSVTAIADHEVLGHRRLLLNLPTGAGKTIVFSSLTEQRQVPTLILVNRRELVKQAYEKLLFVWPEAPVAIWQGGRDPGTPIVIATVQTLVNYLDQATPDRFQLLICDEAHHAVSDTWLQVLMAYGFWPHTPPGKLLVGVTATMTRDDGLGLHNVFPHVAYQLPLLELIQAGYLTDIRALRIRTGIRLEGIAVHDGDYDNAQLSLAMDTTERNGVIARAYRRHALNRHGLGFTASVEHARHLAEACQAENIRADWIAGSQSKTVQSARLKAFRTGELQLLLNAQLLTEGFDEPLVDTIVLARPTQSFSLFSQIVGRGLRLYPGKSHCLVLDFADVTAQHHLLDVGDLVGLDLREIIHEGGVKASAASPEDRRSATPVDPVPITGEIHADRIDLFSGSVFRWQREGKTYRITAGRAQHLLLKPDLEQANRYWILLVDLRVPREDREHVLNPTALPIDWAMGIAEDWLRAHAEDTARRDNPVRDQPPTDAQRALAERYHIPIPPHATQEILDDLLRQAKMKEALDDPEALWRQEPATVRQRQLAKKFGVILDAHATKEDATRAISAAMSHSPQNGV